MCTVVSMNVNLQEWRCNAGATAKRGDLDSERGCGSAHDELAQMREAMIADTVGDDVPVLITAALRAEPDVMSLECCAGIAVRHCSAACGRSIHRVRRRDVCAAWQGWPQPAHARG